MEKDERRLSVEYYYNPEVIFLLIPQSEEKEELVYNNNPYSFQVPKIGPRPPFYTNPRHEQYYPIELPPVK